MKRLVEIIFKESGVIIWHYPPVLEDSAEGEIWLANDYKRIIRDTLDKPFFDGLSLSNSIYTYDEPTKKNIKKYTMMYFKALEKEESKLEEKRWSLVEEISKQQASLRKRIINLKLNKFKEVEECIFV